MLDTMVLNDFEYDKNNDIFIKYISLCNKRIYISLEPDDDMDNLLFIANKLLQNQIYWNEQALKFTVEYFLDSANRWRCGEGQELTCNDIINLLCLDSIGVHKEGDFVFLFDDSIIFIKHSTGKHYLTAEGNLENGFYEAGMFSY